LIRRRTPAKIAPMATKAAVRKIIFRGFLTLSICAGIWALLILFGFLGAVTMYPNQPIRTAIVFDMLIFAFRPILIVGLCWAVVGGLMRLFPDRL
jgi:hypothetical protein